MTANETLAGKTLLVTGASRGIGKAIALRAARDGANVVICAKTTTEHPKLPGTISEAAAECEAAGGKALAVKTDLRFEEQITAAVTQAVEAFGGLDILVNNASALGLTDTLSTTTKMFDRMHGINARGSWLMTRECLPHLLEADNPHVLNVAPPLNFEARWFRDHGAYSSAKYLMSVWVLGMSAEFADRGVAFNALWPRTTIATAAVRNLLGGQSMVDASRHPAVMGDAAHHILTRDSRACTGRYFTDEEALAEAGVTDLDQYAVKPGTPLCPDFFL
jgi:citronellol/citronellal dehydrogenase